MSSCSVLECRGQSISVFQGVCMRFFVHFLCLEFDFLILSIAQCDQRLLQCFISQHLELPRNLESTRNQVLWKGV